MTKGDLLEALASHKVQVIFADYEGKDYFALHLDGARVGAWERVPANTDCTACAARRRKARAKPQA